MTVRCQVVTTIRPDVVFVPYHWAGEKSINLVTISSQDPISKIPEYKVCAVRVELASGTASHPAQSGGQSGGMPHPPQPS